MVGLFHCLCHIHIYLLFQHSTTFPQSQSVTRIKCGIHVWGPGIQRRRSAIQGRGSEIQIPSIRLPHMGHGMGRLCKWLN
jgi:hypothetical protein